MEERERLSSERSEMDTEPLMLSDGSAGCTRRRAQGLVLFSGGAGDLSDDDTGFACSPALLFYNGTAFSEL